MLESFAQLIAEIFSHGMFWRTLYVVITLSIILLVMLENRNPIKAVGWVIILILLPAVGLVTYFFFGRDNRRLRLLSRQAYRRIMNNSIPSIPQEDDGKAMTTQAVSPLIPKTPLSHLIEGQTNAPILVAHSLEVFTDGHSKMGRLYEDIRQAKEHVHVQYYVFSDDDTGKALADLLAIKASEGVKVRVIYDHVGSWEASSRFFKGMRKKGIEVYPFLPVIFPLLTSKVNYRNHRKLIVIDGKIGYVGGMNIANRYTIGNELGIWRDTHVRITGPAINGLQTSFMTDWYVASQRILPIDVYYADHSETTPPERQIPVQFFQSGPTGPWRTLLLALVRAITNARKSVWIETPYFLPNDSLYKAIIGAALSGIDVRLMIPLRGDSRSVRLASDSYIADLLNAGVKVYRYHRSFLHSKLMIVDDELTIIGSANMDFRSMEHNFELTGCIYDRAVNEEMKAVFAQDLKHCTPITAKTWRKRPFGTRLSESFMRLFAPLL